MVRAKFVVQSIARTQWGHEIKLSVVSQGSEEDKAFFLATPAGDITLRTVNDAAMEAFGAPGDKFYVDFTPAEVPVG